MKMSEKNILLFITLGTRVFVAKKIQRTKAFLVMFLPHVWPNFQRSKYFPPFVQFQIAVKYLTTSLILICNRCVILSTNVCFHPRSVYCDSYFGIWLISYLIFQITCCQGRRPKWYAFLSLVASRLTQYQPKSWFILRHFF